jgi:F-type H+-transporting ATPase subunit epsilon
MSATTIQVNIVSADAKIFSGKAELVVAPAIEGEVGIVAGHTQLLTMLKPGPIRIIFPGGEEEVYYISGGFLEVQPLTVTVLADTATRASELDEVKAIQAKEEAERALADRKADFDYSKAAAELAQAVAQIQAIQKIRKKLQH